MIDSARNERKFITTELSYEDLISLVNLHPAGFSRLHCPRVINNIYFDSFELCSFMDNIEGVADRFKIRLRWYGELSGTIQPVLQIKIKNGFSGRKVEYQIDKLALNSGVLWTELRNLIRRCLPEECISLFDFHYYPVVMNSYWREYFVSADGYFRLTIDKSVKYFYQMGSPYPNIENFDSLKDELVMEIKYPVDLDTISHNVTSWFPLRVSKNSKYISGVVLNVGE